MRSSTIRVVMSVWFISKGATVVVVSQCHIKATLLVLAADLGRVPVFLALEALREVIISVVQLAIFELTLK